MHRLASNCTVVVKSFMAKFKPDIVRPEPPEPGALLGMTPVTSGAS